MPEPLHAATGRDRERHGFLRSLLLFILVLVGFYLGIMTLLAIPGFKSTRIAADGVSVYRWSIWLSLGPVLLALVFWALAWRLRGWQSVAGGCAGIGLLALVSGLTVGATELFHPTPFQVVVGPEHFEFNQRVIHFHDLQEIGVDESWSVGMRRGLPYPSHASRLHLVWKDGHEEELNVGGLLEVAVPEILERARASGIRIQVQRSFW